MAISGHQKSVLVMCTANLVLNIFQSASYSTSGIIFLALSHRFPQENPSAVAWVGAIKSTTTGLSCLLLGPLMQQFGVCPIALVGVLLVFLADLTAAFVTSLPLMVAVYGFMAGVGYASFQLMIAVSIQRHVITSRIGLANGVIMSGQGIGIFLWSPLLEYWLETYGWRGALWLEAAMVLHVFVIIYIVHLADKTDAEKEAGNGVNVSGTGKTCETSFADDSSVVPRTLEPKHPGMADANVPQYGGGHGCNDEGVILQCLGELNAECRRTSLLQKDCVDELNKKEKPGKSSKAQNKIKEVFMPLAQIRKYPQFMIYCCALFPAHIGHLAVYFIIPSRGLETGLHAQQASFVISVIGAINLVGRILFGAISDMKFLSDRRVVLTGISFIMNGVGAVICAFLPFPWALFAFAVIFGTGSAFYVSQQNVLCVSLVTVHLMPTASGVMFVCLGSGWLLGFVFSGLLLSTAGGTWPAFVLVGSCLCVGGAMMCTIPCCDARLQKEDKVLEQDVVAA